MLTVLATALARNLRVATLVVAAAMLGVGGAAATVVTVADSTPSTDTSVTATADDSADDPGEDADDSADDQGEDADDQGEDETTEAVESEAVESEAVESDDATEPVATEDVPAPVVTPVACEDATNHGEYISSVARSTEAGPDHGAAVSAAAHEDCGKTDATETTETESTETESTDTAAPTTHGKGHLKPAKVKATTHGKSADHRGLHGKSAGKAKHNR